MIFIITLITLSSCFSSSTGLMDPGIPQGSHIEPASKVTPMPPTSPKPKFTRSRLRVASAESGNPPIDPTEITSPTMLPKSISPCATQDEAIDSKRSTSIGSHRKSKSSALSTSLLEEFESAPMFYSGGEIPSSSTDALPSDLGALRRIQAGTSTSDPHYCNHLPIDIMGEISFTAA